MSHRQAQVELALRFEECLRRFDACIRDYRQPTDVYVLASHLGWLRSKWEPRVPFPSPSSIDWDCLPTSRSSEAVAEVIEAWEHQYQDYLRMIGTPLQLAQVIANHRAVPGNERGDGPGSAKPALYAAVLLNDSGRGDEALAELEAERRVRAADAHRIPLRQRELNVHLCIQERMTRWIQGEIDVPGLES